MCARTHSLSSAAFCKGDAKCSEKKLEEKKATNKPLKLTKEIANLLFFASLMISDWFCRLLPLQITPLFPVVGGFCKLPGSYQGATFTLIGKLCIFMQFPSIFLLLFSFN